MTVSLHEFQLMILKAKVERSVIARLAGMHHDYVNRVLRGEFALTRRTYQRVRLAISRARRADTSPDGEMAAAAFRMAMAIVAERFGASVQDVLMTDPSKRATADPEWLQAAKLRRLALYIANVYLCIPQAELARAAGMSKAAVSIAMNDVEDLRDQPETEALFRTIEEAFA